MLQSFNYTYLLTSIFFSLEKIVSKNEWNEFVPRIEDVKSPEQKRKLIKKYHCINNNVEILPMEVESDLNFNAEVKSRKDNLDYLTLILNVINIPGFGKLAPYFPGKHIRTTPLPRSLPQQVMDIVVHDPDFQIAAPII